jgi:hypothetical protein
MIAGGGDDGLVRFAAQRPYARVLPGFRAFSSSRPNTVPQIFAFQLPGRIALFRIPSLAQRLFVSACDIGWRSLAGIWLFLHKLPLLTILRTNRNADLFKQLGHHF